MNLTTEQRLLTKSFENLSLLLKRCLVVSIRELDVIFASGGFTDHSSVAARAFLCGDKKKNAVTK